MKTTCMESLVGVAHHLYPLMITRMNLGYNRLHPLHPSLASLRKLNTLSNPSPSLPLESVQHSLKPISSHQEPQSLDPGEEENAKIIRRVILKSHRATVGDLVQSLRSDYSCCGIQLTPHLVDSLLERFGDDWKSALGFFRWADSHSGYKHTRYGCNKMVDLLGKVKQFDLMWDLVHTMLSGDCVTLDMIAKIMRRLSGAGKWKDAIKLFDDLESFGFDRDTEAMNILIDTLCKEKKVFLAREVFLELKDQIPPDAYTFNIFVHGWCKARRVDEAMWTIQEMKAYALHPSVITYSTIIRAHCRQSNFHKVYCLLDEMVAEGCPPNVVTYTIIMDSLARSGEFEQALSIPKRMKLSGCKPDALFYNSLISILGRAGQLEQATHIFEVGMQTDGVPRNLSTYNTMISNFCLHRQEQNALEVLTELDSSPCRPDLHSYIPLLKLCFESGMIEDSLKKLLSNIVNKHHLGLDLDTYKLLIHGLCKVRKAEWAFLLFDEMVEREIVPSIRTCRLLMYEAEQNRMDDTLERIRSVMIMNRNDKLI